MNTAMLEALSAFGSGRVDESSFAQAVKLADSLDSGEKVAAPMASMLAALRPTPATAASMRQAFGSGLAASAGIGLAGLGLHGLSKGVGALTERYSKKKDLERILEVFPRLKEYPPAEIELAYNSIRHMNPHVAEDPLAGGSLLFQVLRQRDALDPKTFRMEADLAVNLLRASPEKRNVGEEILRDAVSTGMAMGFQEGAKMREQGRVQEFSRSQSAEERRHREQLIDKEHERRVALETKKLWEQENARREEAKNKEQAARRESVAADKREVLKSILRAGAEPSGAYTVTDPATGKPAVDDNGNVLGDLTFNRLDELTALLNGNRYAPDLAKHFPHLVK